MTEQYFTTEAENLRTRANYLEWLIATLDAYLTSGKSINPGSKAHCDVFCACGHSTQEWLDHPCPWNAAGKAKEAEPHFSNEAHAAITQLEHQRNEGFNMHEVSWVVAEALQRAYAAGLAASLKQFEVGVWGRIVDRLTTPGPETQQDTNKDTLPKEKP